MLDDLPAVAPENDTEAEARPSDDALPTEFPPELKSLPPSELRRVHVAATLYARKKTKSKIKGDELVSDVFIKLTTTRRWKPEKGPLLPYVLRAIKSMLSHERGGLAPERDQTAHEGFYREEQRAHTLSPEDKLLEHRDEHDRQSEAMSELDALGARIADHPLMPRVLACKAQGMMPGEIARALNVPASDVYAAIKLIKHH